MLYNPIINSIRLMRRRAYDKKEYEKSLFKHPAALTAAEVSEILRVRVRIIYRLIKEKSPVGGG